MITIFNGKKYSTETARKVAVGSNGLKPDDVNFVVETLYRKRTGEYFIHGVGGAMSIYAKAAYGGGMMSGENIVPLSFDKAKEWAKKIMPEKEFDDEFGEIADCDTRIIMSITMSESVAKRLRREAAERGISVSTLLERKAVLNLEGHVSYGVFVESSETSISVSDPVDSEEEAIQIASEVAKKYPSGNLVSVWTVGESGEKVACIKVF